MNIRDADFPLHLPSFTEFKDVVGLLSLLNIIILGQILYLPSYADKDIAFGDLNDEIFANSRNEAQELLTFLARSYVITLDNRPVNAFQMFTTYFVLQIRCLISHAGLSRQAAGPQLSDILFRRIATHFSDKHWFIEELVLQQKRMLPATSYYWRFDENYSITPREEASAEGM